MAGIKIGSAAMIEIGYAGENKTREIIFDAKEWMEKLPGCEPAIVGVRADGVEFTAPDVRKDEEEKTIIWTLTDGETIAGEGEAQILWMDGEKVAKKAIMVTMCRASLETKATVPDAPEPTWGQQAIDAMQRAQAAAAKAETALGAVNGAKNEAIEAIGEADAAALEGIAYAKDRALEEIDATAGTAAGSIMLTEAGEVIAVQDSAEKNMRAVKIYGRTTQSGTPTPSAPRPLVTVGADGNVKVSAKDGLPEGGNERITIINQPRSMTTPAGTSAAFHVDAAGEGLTYQWMYSSNGGASFIASGSTGNKTPTVSFTAKDYHNGYPYKCQITDADGNTVTTDVATLTIGEPTETENPVTVQTATIATPGGLPGVPVTSGGNYTDANGQQRIADTIEYNADAGTAKWTKRANTLVFDGSEDEDWRVNGGRMQLNVKDVIFPNRASEMPAVMCDKFEAKTANQTYDGQVGISLQGFGGGSGAIFIRYGATADIAEWRNMLAEEPMMCIVALAEPIETQLSEEETAQIAALKTYYPETTVYNEDSAHMEIKYVADTKTYIDRENVQMAQELLDIADQAQKNAEDITSLSEEFAKLNGESGTEIITVTFTADDVLDECFINQYGDTSAAATGYHCINYTSISRFAEGKPVTAYCTIFGNCSLAFYDASKNVQLLINGNNASDYGITPGAPMQEISVVPPEGAEYIRFGANSVQAGANYTGPESFYLKGTVVTESAGTLEKVNRLTRASLTNFSDFRVLVLGDSISTDYYGEYEKWVTALCNIGFFSAGKVDNESIHATGFVARYNDSVSTFLQRINAIENPGKYDLVIVFGGINDFIQNIPFGEAGGDETSYFIPAVDAFFESLTTKFVGARIAVLLPLRTRFNNANTEGKRETEYGDYIKTVAEEYSLPVLDLTRQSGFYPYKTAFRDKWTLTEYVGGDGVTGDGVHPNEEYERTFLAPMIRHFLQGLM